MAILDFSVSGWHGFGSVTQVCFEISVSNFMCMSFVAVGRSLTIVSYVAFKMAALWFWTMFNCNPPIAHCHPLLWGGGILVDHWSTISSSSQMCHINVLWVIPFPGSHWINWSTIQKGTVWVSLLQVIIKQELCRFYWSLGRCDIVIYWADYFIWEKMQPADFIENIDQWPLLLTWFNFNPSMDK